MHRVAGITIDPASVATPRPDHQTARAAGPRADPPPLPGAKETRANQPAAPDREPRAGPARGLSSDQMQELVQKVNEVLRENVANDHEVSLALSGDQEDQWVIEVREKESGDLVVQFPSESLLKINEQLEKLAGLLFDRLS